MTVYPSLVENAAKKMDSLQSGVLERLLGLSIPMEESGLSYDCPISVPVDRLHGRSFQHYVVRQPVKMGGLGLRSNAETCLPAFIGGLELALPHLTGPGGICRILENTLGDGSLPSETRWKPLLDSGCRTGEELKRAWLILQQEDQQSREFLQQEQKGPLLVNVEGAGEGSIDGKTRQKVMQHLEETRGAVLAEGLKRIPGKCCRQAVLWHNRDKMSSAWLHCLPGPEGLNNASFSEALALTLAMPSPACRAHTGQQIKVGDSACVDIYGDKVMSAVLPGDHWRIRHDTVKMELSSLCTFAKLEHTTEVFGLFAPLIPQQALSRYERGRKRQGLVPDFRLRISNNTNAARHQLAELKLISCCDAWYASSSGGNVRAVEKRANGLPADYRRRAREADRESRQATGDARGPVEQRLEEHGDLLGLVFGATGEASEGVHKLVTNLAESRLNAKERTRGRPGSKQELGLITSQIRRRLSQTVIKAQVECLLSRLHLIGPGSKAMIQRREWAVREEERMKRERNADWLRKTEGIFALRKGMIKTV